jgi:hypothetical protein
MNPNIAIYCVRNPCVSYELSVKNLRWGEVRGQKKTQQNATTDALVRHK